jgi:CcmD family protein
VVCVSIALAHGPVLTFQPPAPQTEFKPIAEVPATEQLPGGVFVVVAYAFIWVVTMLYVWSIWRRLRKVEDEMRALQHVGARGTERR